MTQAKLFLAGMVLLTALIVGNAILGLNNKSDITSQNHAIASNVSSVNGLSKATARDLKNYKAQTKERRKENAHNLAVLRAETAQNRRLTEQVAVLSEQRNADNAAAIAQEAALSDANHQELASLNVAEGRIAAAQAKITSLEATTRHESLQAQYNTCIAVDQLKRSMHHTLVAIFAAFKLTPAQQAGIDKLEALFNPLVCIKP